MPASNAKEIQRSMQTSTIMLRVLLRPAADWTAGMRDTRQLQTEEQLHRLFEVFGERTFTSQ